MKVVNRDYTINYVVGRSDYGLITVPKGTPVTSQTALGYDPEYNFVNEFSWVKPHEDGTKQFGLLHDLRTRGLNVPKEYVSELDYVKFYVKDDEVYAVFPAQKGPEPNMYVGYAHIGQHTAIHGDYIKDSRVATKEEYQDLYEELTKLIGYYLVVLQ